MNKEEILAKSRQEHKNRDLYKAEVEARASSVAIMAAAVLATVFFVLQLLLGRGVNFGLYAILFSVGAAQFIVKAAYLKTRRALVLAAVYTAVTLALCAAHIYTLAV